MSWCKDCKHWDTKGYNEPIDGRQFGQCLMLTSGERDEVAVVFSSDDSHAVVTEQFFGCLLFQEKGGG